MMIIVADGLRMSCRRLNQMSPHHGAHHGKVLHTPKVMALAAGTTARNCVACRGGCSAVNNAALDNLIRCSHRSFT